MTAWDKPIFHHQFSPTVSVAHSDTYHNIFWKTGTYPGVRNDVHHIGTNPATVCSLTLISTGSSTWALSSVATTVGNYRKFKTVTLYIHYTVLKYQCRRSLIHFRKVDCYPQLQYSDLSTTQHVATYRLQARTHRGLGGGNEPPHFSRRSALTS